MKIARVAGIDIFVHATFLIIVAWAAFIGWSGGGTLGAMLGSTAFLLALFFCVALHELGHAFAARRYGIGTKDITLLPIGGVARLERMPEEPRQEIAVALAGPAVNVAIALILGGWLWLTGGAGAAFLQPLLIVNIVLVAFNLIPAFPLDGGRVLRAVLARSTGRARATRIAARVGQGFAILFGVVGLFSNIFLAVIGIFVWFAAAGEERAVAFRGAMGRATVDDAMLTSFRSLDANDTVERAGILAHVGMQRDFPVVLRGTLIGLFRSEDLLRALREGLADTPVHRLMQREVVTVEGHEKLRDVFPRLASADAGAFPVVWRGELVGLLTKERIHDFTEMAHARRRRTATSVRTALARS